MFDYIDALIDISYQKYRLTENYMKKISENNESFFVVKSKYEKERLFLDDEFLKCYMEFLSKEGVVSIGEVDKYKHKNLKNLKSIVSDIDALERDITKFENDLLIKLKRKESFSKATSAYKIYKKK